MRKLLAIIIGAVGLTATSSVLTSNVVSCGSKTYTQKNGDTDNTNFDQLLNDYASDTGVSKSNVYYIKYKITLSFLKSYNTSDVTSLTKLEDDIENHIDTSIPDGDDKSIDYGVIFFSSTDEVTSTTTDITIANIIKYKITESYSVKYSEITSDTTITWKVTKL